MSFLLEKIRVKVVPETNSLKKERNHYFTIKYKDILLLVVILN